MSSKLFELLVECTRQVMAFGVGGCLPESRVSGCCSCM